MVAALILSAVEGQWWYDDLLIRQLHLVTMGFSDETVKFLTS